MRSTTQDASATVVDDAAMATGSFEDFYLRHQRSVGSDAFVLPPDPALTRDDPGVPPSTLVRAREWRNWQTRRT
jgi:hypothetical protein